DVLGRKPVRGLTRPVRRRIVDDQQAEPIVLQYASGEHRKVFAFVIGRNDDEYVHVLRGPPARPPTQSTPDRSQECEIAPAERTRGRRLQWRAPSARAARAA